MFQKVSMGALLAISTMLFGCETNYWYGAQTAKEDEKLGDQAPIVRMTEAQVVTAAELREKAAEIEALAEKLETQQSELSNELASHFESQGEKMELYAEEMDALASMVEGKVLTTAEGRLANNALTKQGLSLVDLNAVGFAKDKDAQPSNEAKLYASHLRAAATALRGESVPQSATAAAPRPLPGLDRAATEAAKAELVLEAARRNAKPPITEVGPAPSEDDAVKGVIVDSETAEEKGIIPSSEEKSVLEKPTLSEIEP